MIHLFINGVSDRCCVSGSHRKYYHHIGEESSCWDRQLGRLSGRQGLKKRAQDHRGRWNFRNHLVHIPTFVNWILTGWKTVLPT